MSEELGLDFKTFIFDAGNQETLENTRYTQPALFAIGVSLGQTLLDWGIEPDFLIGHSIGEFAAAHLAGVFSLEDGIKLIAARGRLMASLPRGRMLSVRGPMETVLAAAGEAVDVASINSPVHCVLSGEDTLIARIQPRLEAAGLPCRPLHTSHAFHSRMMSPVVEPFLDVVRTVSICPPRLTIVSTVTGEPLGAAQATSAEYWAQHLRATVRFSPALQRCLTGGGNLFLEVGPRATLSALATQHFPKDAKPGAQPVGISMLSDQPDVASEVGSFGGALARLWTSGDELPWDRIWGRGQRVPLAALQPFDRKEFRYSEGRPSTRPARTAAASLPAEGPSRTSSSPAPAAVEPAQSATELLHGELGALFSEFSGLTVAQIDSTFVEAGFDSLVLMQIGVEVGKKYGVAVSLRELMGQYNTLRSLADHVNARAAPDKLPRARAVTSSDLPTQVPVQVPVQAVVAPIDLIQIIHQQLQQLEQMRQVLAQHMRFLTAAPALLSVPVASAAAAEPAAPAAAAPSSPAALAGVPDGGVAISAAPTRKLIRARYTATLTV